ncbi:alpha/beta hydrolase [Streptomyces sp. NBC_01622]|nr:alpha/beta hydrolase [Streptomyces sp. NBC_01622]
MADDASVFVETLGLDDVDVLGFSIGSFVAQELALTRPSLAGKLVLASTAPQGAPGMHGRAPDIIGAIGEATTDADGMRRPGPSTASVRTLERTRSSSSPAAGSSLHPVYPSPIERQGRMTKSDESFMTVEEARRISDDVMIVRGEATGAPVKEFWGAAPVTWRQP